RHELSEPPDDVILEVRGGYAGPAGVCFRRGLMREAGTLHIAPPANRGGEAGRREESGQPSGVEEGGRATSSGSRLHTTRRASRWPSASVLHETRAARQAAERLRAWRALALARPLRAPRSALHRSAANLATPSPS